MVRKVLLAMLVALVTGGAGVVGSQALPIAPVQTGVGDAADGVQLAGYRYWHGHRYHYRHGAYRYYHGGWWYPSPWWTMGYSGYYVAPYVGVPVLGVGIGVGPGYYYGHGHYHGHYHGHGHGHCHHHKCY